MLPALSKRILSEVAPKCLWKLFRNFAIKGYARSREFQKRHATSAFPAFIVISATNACTLSCQGCWVSPSSPPTHLPPETLDRIISETKKDGSFFFGILGGEPLLYPGIFDVISKHPDCYFQLFTNGTLLTRETAETMRRLGNVTPLISVEGDETVSDIRRGGENVFQRTFEGIKHCRDAGLFIGMATSVCKSNIDALASMNFLKRAISSGIHYVWYYIYRPVGPNPTPELALDQEQITRLREFIVNARSKTPVLIIDAYWDHEGKAICPGALGLSHHVNPAGDIEFCPPIQFAKDNIPSSDKPLRQLFQDSSFLRDFREFATKTTPGCVILEHPEKLKAFLESQDAMDTTGRNAGITELSAMSPLPGHHDPKHQIPEKHWIYKWGKKHFSLGFGAYG